jgi:hypothetical protein
MNVGAASLRAAHDARIGARATIEVMKMATRKTIRFMAVSVYEHSVTKVGVLWKEDLRESYGNKANELFQKAYLRATKKDDKLIVFKESDVSESLASLVLTLQSGSCRTDGHVSSFGFDITGKVHTGSLSGFALSLFFNT